MDGHQTLIVDFTPRPNFKVTMKEVKPLKKISGPSFNLTNTAHLGKPGNSRATGPIDANNTNGARIFLADLPRIIQFALKYNF